MYCVYSYFKIVVLFLKSQEHKSTTTVTLTMSPALIIVLYLLRGVKQHYQDMGPYGINTINARERNANKELHNIITKLN